MVSGGLEYVRVGGKDVNARAYLSRFNFSGADQEKLCGVLSGGERNRLHLALTLKAGANVLLLDEPTNDIDVNTLRALEEGLENFAGCAVVISHDRWFLDRICTHILAFEGNSEVFFFEGSYSEYEEKMRLGKNKTSSIQKVVGSCIGVNEIHPYITIRNNFQSVCEDTYCSTTTFAVLLKLSIGFR